MKARAGKQKVSKRRAAAMADVRENKWPVLLDQLAFIEQPGGVIFLDSEKERFVTPKKLRGKLDYLRSLFLAWVVTPEENKCYWIDGFWRDLCRYNVKFPVIMPELVRVLWWATRQTPGKGSEALRELADYIDALNAKKGDRGRRLVVTEMLYLYAYRVKAREHRVLTWRELREEFWPDYADTSANWQKFLRERGIPFKKVGQFRGQKCVQKS